MSANTSFSSSTLTGAPTTSTDPNTLSTEGPSPESFTWSTGTAPSTTARLRPSQPDGLAVLGIFIEVSEEANPEFEKLCKLLDKIKFKNQKASFTEPVDVKKFLPKEEDDKTFWTYEGSLTTPPLLESVTWIVFKRPLRVSVDQLNSMRSLMFCTLETHESDGGEKMVNNFRPPCPRGERKIRRC